MKNWLTTYLLQTKLLFACYITMQIMFDFSINKYQTNKYFYSNFWVAESYTALCWTQSLSKTFLNMEISQGSVVTRLTFGAMFNNDFITNLLVNRWVFNIGVCKKETIDRSAFMLLTTVSRQPCRRRRPASAKRRAKTRRS